MSRLITEKREERFFGSSDAHVPYSAQSFIILFHYRERLDIIRKGRICAISARVIDENSVVHFPFNRCWLKLATTSAPSSFRKRVSNSSTPWTCPKRDDPRIPQVWNRSLSNFSLLPFHSSRPLSPSSFLRFDRRVSNFQMLAIFHALVASLIPRQYISSVCTIGNGSNEKRDFDSFAFRFLPPWPAFLPDETTASRQGMRTRGGRSDILEEDVHNSTVMA